MSDNNAVQFEERRAQTRDRHLLPADKRPASTARGLHHTALISSDVERTVKFYQDLLGFPLTELIENTLEQSGRVQVSPPGRLLRVAQPPRRFHDTSISEVVDNEIK